MCASSFALALSPVAAPAPAPSPLPSPFPPLPRPFLALARFCAPHSAVPHGRLVVAVGSAAVLRQQPLRHCAGARTCGEDSARRAHRDAPSAHSPSSPIFALPAEREPDQRQGAVRLHGGRGAPPHQHRLGLGGAAQHPRQQPPADRQAPRHRGGHFHRDCEPAPVVPRRLRLRRDDHRCVAAGWDCGWGEVGGIAGGSGVGWEGRVESGHGPCAANPV